MDNSPQIIQMVGAISFTTTCYELHLQIVFLSHLRGTDEYQG